MKTSICSFKVAFWTWAVAWVLAGFSLSASAQRYYAFNRATFSTGKAPSSIVSGDFDGDGLLDFVVANNKSASVSLLRGRPDGTLGPHTEFPAGVEPLSVVAGDFNGDGALDVAVANSGSGSISVLLGTGTGSFGPHDDFTAGTTPVYIVAADLNGDGKLDLATANSNDSTVSVLLGHGDGTFALRQTFPGGSNPQSLASADVNLDGKLDLVTADHDDSSVAVLLGNGDGNFQSEVEYGIGSGSPTSVAVADLNHDGTPDLAVGVDHFLCCFGTVSIFLGHGDGSFDSPTSYNTGAQPFSVRAADLDGDGNLDLAVTTYIGVNGFYFVPAGVSVMLGAGDGTFSKQEAYATGDRPADLSIADINGDHILDMVVVNQGDSTASVLLGQGGRRFSVNQFMATPAAVSDVVVADFNQDGRPDLALGEGDNVSVYLASDRGVFKDHSEYLSGGSAGAMAVGDFNGDLNPDLAITNSGGTVSVILGISGGGFGAPVSYSTGVLPWAVTVNDFNGDSIPDLAVTNFDSFNVSVLFGNGDGSFQASSSYDVNGQQPLGIASADFNGDGAPDLAVAANFGSFVLVLLNDGQGHFGAPVKFSTQQITAGVTTGDFNEDGKIDIAASSNDGAVFVLLGNGDGTFQPSVVYGLYPDDSVGDIVVADLDGDGHEDLVAAASLFVLFLHGHGDGRFSPATYYLEGTPGPGIGDSGFGIADFNHDGSLDMAFAAGTMLDVIYNNPVIALAPSSLDFGKVQVGGTSSPQQIQISNPSLARLRFLNVAVTGTNARDFAITNECGQGIATGKHCTISITFTPSGLGNRDASLVLTDSAPMQIQTVPLTGTGTASSRRELYR